MVLDVRRLIATSPLPLCHARQPECSHRRHRGLPQPPNSEALSHQVTPLQVVKRTFPFVFKHIERLSLHLLLRIRSKLLDKRKYIFSIYDDATRLAYVGVVQFGPQKLKEKDQVFLYVNQTASLLDTVSSARGYHQVKWRSKS